jgi:positive regulator of sigma E activity
MLPGLTLNDDSILRIAVIHYLVPSFALFVAVDHINNLHLVEYTDEDEMEAMFVARLEYADEFF